MENERMAQNENEDMVTISCGANPPQEVQGVAGLTVEEVCVRLEDILNFPEPSVRLYVLNGDFVEKDYILQAGDHIECVKQAGKKS